MPEHFIAGKDASLETSIARMQSKLDELGFHLDERSWLNSINDIWSVHLVDQDCPLLFSNGKGASKLAARASALGEFVERLSTNHFWNSYYLGKEFATDHHCIHHPREQWFEFDNADIDGWAQELLTPELQKLYNPDNAISSQTLVDHNSGNTERGICALPFTSLSDNTTVWFPVNIISNLYVSNGISAGNSREEARAQALAEIVERHIKFRIIREGLCLPDIPEEVIARYPQLAADIHELRTAGFGVLIKDASLGGHYPVVCVALLNPHDQGCYASFGSHPRFEIALERSLSELLQGRSLDALNGFSEPSFDLDEVASIPNLEAHFIDSSGIIHWNFFDNSADFDFADWTSTASTHEDYARLVELILDEGYDIYVTDYSHLGMYACRIIVPGMSEIYPIDDLEYENNSFGNTIREQILALSDLDDDECESLLDTLNDSNIDEQRLVAALIGLAPDAGSFWEELRVGELKTLLALAIADEEATREGCHWIRHFGQINPERLRVYRCIETLLNLSDTGTSSGFDNYRSALEHLFSLPTLNRAIALLVREERFFNIPPLGVNLEDCQMHQRLLCSYRKVHTQHEAEALHHGS